MAGNFVAGLVWGGLVAGLGLAVISPMAPLLGPQMDRLALEQPVTEAKPEEAKIAEPAPVQPDPVKTEPAPQPAPEPAPAASAEPVADPSKDAILLPAQPEAPAATVSPEPTTAQTVTTQPAAKVETVEVAPSAATAASPVVTTENAATQETVPATTVTAASPGEPSAAPATTAAPAEPAPAEPAPTDPAPKAPEPEPEPDVAAVPVDPAAGVTTNRLPTIGKATEEPASDAVAPTNDAADAIPMVRYARAFENLTGNPPMAILLIDDGSEGIDRQALAALPFPVTFVLDPLAFNAPEAAAIYRAAGQEVAMLATGIPEGATASDLEQTFQAHEAVVPEAVAYVDLAEGGFQSNRPLATEVVATLAPRGRGLVTYDQGLNSAQQVAQRSGMPNTAILRTLDGDGQAAMAIKRLLDGVAFNAVRNRSAVAIGHARPETVQGLIEWTMTGDRKDAVTLAPLTAVLQAGG